MSEIGEGRASMAVDGSGRPLHIFNYGASEGTIPLKSGIGIGGIGNWSCYIVVGTIPPKSGIVNGIGIGGIGNWSFTTRLKGQICTLLPIMPGVN